MIKAINFISLVRGNELCHTPLFDRFDKARTDFDGKMSTRMTPMGKTSDVKDLHGDGVCDINHTLVLVQAQQ